MKSIDEIISESIAELEDKDKKIEELRSVFRDKLKEQEKEFFDLGEKVYPIIKFMKDKNYYFFNERLDCNSSRGPVVGRNNNILYIYEGGRYLIYKYDLYSEEGIEIPFNKFILENSFDDAIDGLLSLLRLQDHILNKYTGNIDKIDNELKNLVKFF